MKKNQVINSHIARLISQLGHTDQITIADAGLPIPMSVERIDLALSKNIPSFMQVLENTCSEMQVEKVILAEEIIERNPQLYQQILAFIQTLQQQQNNTIAIEYCSHQLFKQQTQNSRAIIRSGEFSPYANIILCSGVVF